MSVVHVALCFTDAAGRYYKHALVTALSVLDNAQGPVVLHLVHDGTVSSEAQAAFEGICGRYGQKLALYRAREISQETQKNIPAFLGKGTLYKTMLPELIQEDKVLYLDCDIICACDVANIFTHDVSGYYLGAVKMGQEQGLKWVRKLGLRSAFCINAGVLLMNLAKIRREIPEYTDRLLEVVRTARIQVGDQGATNIFFDGKADAYRFLPEFCNVRVEQQDNATLPMSGYRGKVIHFAGKKPWEVFSAPALWYWKYYSMAFPEEDVFALMEKLEPYEYAPLFSFVMRHERVRRWIGRLHEAEQKGWRAMLRRRMRW